MTKSLSKWRYIYYDVIKELITLAGKNILNNIPEAMWNGGGGGYLKNDGIGLF